MNQTSTASLETAPAEACAMQPACELVFLRELRNRDQKIHDRLDSICDDVKAIRSKVEGLQDAASGTVEVSAGPVRVRGKGAKVAALIAILAALGSGAWVAGQWAPEHPAKAQATK